jgi:hypothetical protein
MVSFQVHMTVTKEFGLLRFYTTYPENVGSLLLFPLLLLALQPTMGFSLLSDFLPFRPFLTQFSPPS